MTGILKILWLIYLKWNQKTIMVFELFMKDCLKAKFSRILLRRGKKEYYNIWTFTENFSCALLFINWLLILKFKILLTLSFKLARKCITSKFSPYFGIFGDNSQFNNLREALGESTKFVYAVETGLSADPLKIRSISDLNNISIISNLDSQSTNYHRLGSEGIILKFNNLNYRNLINSIRKNRI